MFTVGGDINSERQIWRRGRWMFTVGAICAVKGNYVAMARYGCGR